MTYTTVADVRRIRDLGDAAPDPVYEDAIAAAVGQIDEFCGRNFRLDVAGVREYEVELDFLGGRSASMSIDDIMADGVTDVTVELTTDPSDDDSWELQESGWWLGPRTPKDGWPHTELVVRQTYGWQGRYARITADFGWDAVPAQVQRAALMMSARVMQREDSVLGIQTTSEFGVTMAYARPDPDTARMLRPFKRDYLISRNE